MKRNIKTLTCIMLALLLTTFIVPNFVSAATPASGQVDHVLIRTANGNIVRITIEQYVDLFLFKTQPLFDFLKTTSGNLVVYGVVSGEKYIEIDEYVSKFITFGSANKALNAADEISPSGFFKIKPGSIEAGNIQIEPISGAVEDLVVIDIY